MWHSSQNRLPKVSTGRLPIVASSQVFSLQFVVVLGDSFVLQLCCVFVEVQALVLPPQAASTSLKSIHGEVTGDVHTL